MKPNSSATHFLPKRKQIIDHVLKSLKRYWENDSKSLSLLWNEFTTFLRHENPGEYEKFISESILKTRFECQIREEQKIKNMSCIIPEIKGQAWITGEQSLYISDDIPFPMGYRLTDTWPEN